MRIPLNKKQFLKIYRNRLVSSDKRVFEFLFNLRSFFLKSPSRVRWDDSAFIVTDLTLPGFQYRFRHQKQGTMAYEWGIKKRAEVINKVYFLDKIEFCSGDVFIDCGANVGDLKLWFDLNDIEVEYIGFEPSPIEFECLEKNVAPKTAHNLGLWNEDGTLRFYISSQGADSSLIQPAEYSSVVDVDVKRLNDFIEGPIKCLKLEAEGAEPEVLSGVDDTKLQMIEYVAADLGYERGVDAESTLVPVTNYLLSRGFELVDVSHGRICALYRNTHSTYSDKAAS